VHMCFDRAEADDVIIAHCHAPNHFDNGMGALYRVTAPLPPKPTVTGLSLVNSKTNAKIVDLADGMVINVKDISGLSTPSFNINASYTGDVESVEYWYGYDKYRIEEVAPYSFCGNWRNDFFRCRKLGCGNHTVSAVPYTQPSAQGEVGAGLMVSFAIVCV
jgi:hypothetical protein